MKTNDIKTCKYQMCNEKPLFGEQPIQCPEEKGQKEKIYSQKNKKKPKKQQIPTNRE